jgi:ADP-heptose:LPS heptosyltransferase
MEYKIELQMKFVKVYILFCNAILSLAKLFIYKKNNAPNRILIFRTGSLGDSICALPAIDLIRRTFPKSRIDILTNAGANNLVSIGQLISPDIFHEVIDYQNLTRKEWTIKIREIKYDLIIELPQYMVNLKSQLRNLIYFKFHCKINSGFGWQVSHCSFFKKGQEKSRLFLNETERLRNIILQNFDNLMSDQTDAFPYHISESDSTKIDEIKKLKSIFNSKPTIALVVGAKRTQNRWPESYFEQVVSYFGDKINWIAIGSQEDTPIVLNIQKKNMITDFTGKLTPIQSGLIMKHCNLVLTNDTGPMHLAYSMGATVFALFSSRDFPGKWFPPKVNNNRIFRTDYIECSVCFTDSCSDNKCMQLIKPDFIIEEITKFLSFTINIKPTLTKKIEQK